MSASPSFFLRLNLLILTTAAKLKREISHQASASFLDEFFKIPNAVSQDNFYLIHFLKKVCWVFQHGFKSMEATLGAH